MKKLIIILLIVAGILFFSYANKKDVPLAREKAIELLQSQYSELKGYPSDNLPPKRIETKQNERGWLVGFYTEGSGRPGILSAQCFAVSHEKTITKVGEFTASENGATSIDLATCTDNGSSTQFVLNDVKTFSNKEYGFSFQYPSSWILTEDTTKKQVTLSTPDTVSLEGNSMYPVWSVTFTSTDTTFFTPPIGTKYGTISYDEKRAALVDGTTCLKAEKLFGNFEGNTTTIQAIRYGGSTMSDPAHAESAVLTKNGKIIIVKSDQAVPSTSLLESQRFLIASSLTLLNGNTAFVPMCAK